MKLRIPKRQPGTPGAEAALVHVDLGPSVHVGFVDVLVDLLSALDEIKRGDEAVGSTACDGTAEGAGVVVLGRVDRDLARTTGGGVLSLADAL